jgi:hypothetical protein
LFLLKQGEVPIMLVFGDVARWEEAQEMAAEIAHRFDDWLAASPGMKRHQQLAGAFIRTGELVQAVVDSEFAESKCDETTERRHIGEALLVRLARAVAASWDSDGREVVPVDWLDPLRTLADAGRLETKRAEGYAFYALYPEAYLAAAREAGLGADTTVIGIRSIGAGLAAVVAAGLGVGRIHTVRPVGHPFARRVEIGPDLAANILAGRGDFAIVDEGPGLSGSSFNCVADWLVQHGVDDSRIHFFPSHAGDLGSHASSEHWERWTRARKHVLSFEQVILNPAKHHQRLKHWIASAVGPLEGPLVDLSGGAWRERWCGSEQIWPPADPAMEKRKFLARAGGKAWLAKFVGLGASGEEKHLLAQHLAEAGFAPEPRGLCHGFLIMPWVERDANSSAGPPLERVADYLARRASLPVSVPGASTGALFEMALHNLGEALGKGAADKIGSVLRNPERFTPIYCATDNRMHEWEWVQADGTWLKLDGLDHHAAHDLIGCQDIAWDLAGAKVELGLAEQQGQELTASLEQRIGRTIPPDYLRAMELCYIAFQIGLWTMAQSRNGEVERQRIKALLRRYEDRAARLLGSTLNHLG